VGVFCAPIAALLAPLLNGERVTTRFLIVPVLALALAGAPRLQAWLDAAGSRARLVAALAIVQLGVELATHSTVWRDQRLEQTCTDRVPELAVRIVAQSDPAYVITLWASLRRGRVVPARDEARAGRAPGALDVSMPAPAARCDASARALIHIRFAGAAIPSRGPSCLTDGRLHPHGRNLSPKAPRQSTWQ
jgi:hypothetical protein